jgi:RNA polymerase sigma factor for flagellar operon FliA
MTSAALTDEHARELWMQFRASGDSDLRERLVERYLPLARSAAARCFRLRADNAVPFADYLQYARVGLVEAIDGFDPTREASFETYSSYRIRGAMLNGLARESEVAAQRTFWRTRVEDRVSSLMPSVTSSGDEELEELARMTMGLAIGFLLDSEPEQLIDEAPQANPYAATELAQVREAVRELVDQLPGRERLLIQRHYFEHCEFRVIAHELSVTPGRVSQIHAQALGHIRDLLKQRSSLDTEV